MSDAICLMSCLQPSLPCHCEPLSYSLLTSWTILSIENKYFPNMWDNPGPGRRRLLLTSPATSAAESSHKKFITPAESIPDFILGVGALLRKWFYNTVRDVRWGGGQFSHPTTFNWLVRFSRSVSTSTVHQTNCRLIRYSPSVPMSTVHQTNVSLRWLWVMSGISSPSHDITSETYTFVWWTVLMGTDGE